MKIFLILFFLITSKAFAGMTYFDPLLYAGTTAAVVVGTEAAIYNSLVETELKSWSDKKTGTTIQLENQCDLEAELHLTGNHRRNSVFIGLTNLSKKNISVKFRDVKFTYDNQRVRYPGYTIETSDARIAPGWWQMTWIPFPSKDEFQKLQVIDVEIPTVDEESGKSCVLKSKFKRTSVVKEEEISYSSFDIVFDGGPSLSQSGEIRELGDPSGIFSMEFNYFPKPKHGMGLVFSSEFGFSGSRNQRVIEEFDGRSNYYASASYFGLQYIYRHFLTQKVFLTFGIGGGSQFISDNDSNRYRGRDNGTIDFAMSDKLMLNWIFYRWKTPGTDLDFFTGIGLNHFWTPSARMNGQDLSGHRVSGLLRFGMGF